MAYDNNIYARIISGEVSDQEINQLKARGEWDEIQKIIDMTNTFSLPDRNMEEGYAMLANRKSKLKKNTVKTFTLSRIASMAALFIVVIGAGWFFLLPITHTAPNGEALSVILPDDSKVEINDGSRIQYGKSFAKNRVVHLKGEAHFDVQSGESFVVETDKGSIQVLGTQFNVNSWSEKLRVECYEGRVEVVSGLQKVVLTAGELIDFNHSSSMIPTKISYDLPSWMEGLSKFSDRPFQEVVDEMERQFDIEITTNISQRRFVGVFSHFSLKVALDEVCKPLGLKHEIRDNGTVIITESK